MSRSIAVRDQLDLPGRHALGDDPVPDALGEGHDAVGAGVAEALQAAGDRDVRRSVSRPIAIAESGNRSRTSSTKRAPRARARAAAAAARGQRRRRRHHHVRPAGRASRRGPTTTRTCRSWLIARAQVAAVAGGRVGAPDVDPVLDLVDHPPPAVALGDRALLVLDVGGHDGHLVAGAGEGAGVLPVAHAAGLVGVDEVLRDVEDPHGLEDLRVERLSAPAPGPRSPGRRGRPPGRRRPSARPRRRGRAGGRARRRAPRRRPGGTTIPQPAARTIAPMRPRSPATTGRPAAIASTSFVGTARS